MTEKDKMLNQMMYDANYDKELIEERKKAKELCFQFNNANPSDEKKQKEILKQLLGKQMIIFVLLAHFGVIMGIT